MYKKIALISLLIILCLVNLAVFGKEKHIAEGRIVYLDLAPIDPRSLMQGDYMALSFQMADEVYRALPKFEEKRRWRHNVNGSDGYVIAELDDRNIGTFKKIYSEQTLSGNEILLRYRVRNGTVKFATNAFFFQEGHGKYYQDARYGQFRVDRKGELLLTAMYDKNLKKMEALNEKECE